MSWLSDIGEYVGITTDLNLADQDWLGPAINLAGGALSQYNSDNAESQYLDYLRERENQNYQNSINAANTYNQQLAASGAARAAAAAAARQTEANRIRAEKKANKITQKTYKDILGMYAPYKAVADELLPLKTATYKDSLGLMGGLNKFVNDPAQQAKLTEPRVPAWNIQVPLPDSVRIK